MLKKRILIVYNEEFPWDIRIEKFCKSYIDNNYEVYLLCNNKESLKLEEIYSDINIIRIIKGGNKILKLPIFINPIWISKIYKTVKKYKIEIILIRDLPLALAGIVIGKICKIPSIYDMAENYPEATKIWKKTGDYKGVFDKIIRSNSLLKIVEKVSCKYADQIFVVIEENLERLKMIGIDSKKITVIENTPELGNLLNLELDKNDDCISFNGHFILGYVGGFQFHRGISNVIAGMEMIVRKIPDILLILVGEGPQRKVYENEVKNRKLENNVIFLGYIKWPKIFKYINLSDLCLIPHLKSGHTDTTMPNKIYDYLCFKKPVLVSDAIPLKRIVIEEGCGEFFETGNMDDFVKKVIYLYKDKKRLEDMGKNGFEAIINKYNWEITRQRLIDSTNSLLEKNVEKNNFNYLN